MIERTLIITGCISPIKQKWLEISDVEQRLRQYIESISFYIEKSECNHIIFCDNSLYKYDYSKLVSLAKRNNKIFEWISFKGNSQLVKERGKGIGEGEIIDYAINHSKYKISCIEKVTGRLLIENIDSIERKIKSGEQIYINKDIYIFPDERAFDTRFYACPAKEYTEIISESYKKTDDRYNKNIEKLLYLSLRNVKCLPCYPIVKGKSGGLGYEYGDEKKIRIKVLNFLCITKGFNNQILFKITRKLLRIAKQW